METLFSLSSLVQHQVYTTVHLISCAAVAGPIAAAACPPPPHSFHSIHCRRDVLVVVRSVHLVEEGAQLLHEEQRAEQTDKFAALHKIVALGRGVLVCLHQHGRVAGPLLTLDKGGNLRQADNAVSVGIKRAPGRLKSTKEEKEEDEEERGCVVSFNIWAIVKIAPRQRAAINRLFMYVTIPRRLLRAGSILLASRGQQLLYTQYLLYFAVLYCTALGLPQTVTGPQTIV